MQTSKQIFHGFAVDALERIIEVANQDPTPRNFSIAHPTSAPYWLIDYLIRHKLLDTDERPSSKLVNDVIIKSTTRPQLKANYHDLFYGFIGKALISMESNSEAYRPYVFHILNVLKVNAIKDSDGLYWNTPDPFYPSPNFIKSINFGIPHGSLGIILFLLKSCETYSLCAELEFFLKNSIEWVIKRLAIERNKLPYQYSDKASGTGRLGWCYGDQAIAFTLLRYYETFNCEKAKLKAYELIEQAASKPIEQTGVEFYPKYGYYDMRICHGTSSVAYMWQKMYHITKDENIKSLADKWMDITLDNLEIFLPQLDKIAELEKDNDMIDTSMGFLNGLSGVGLVLIAFQDPKLSDWDKLLLLDRPGRE